MFYLDSRYRGAATEEKRFHLIQVLHRVVHPTQWVVPVSRLDCKETRTEAAILLNVCCSVYILAVLTDQVYSRVPGKVEDSSGQGMNVIFCGVLPD